MLTHNALRINPVELMCPNLPPAWDKLCVVQISDLHFYEHSDPAYYRRVQQEIKNQRPELLLVTGDIVHYGDRHVRQAQDFLSALDIPMGKLGVMGNHDYYDFQGGEAISAMHAASGVQLLKNQSVCFERDGQRLWFAGLDDLWCGAPDIEKALSGIPVDECVLMLAHNPLLIDPVSQYPEKRVDVMFSGHTHAGHVYLPFLELIYRHVFKMKYRYAHHQKMALPPSQYGTQLYVSSGVGSAAFYWKSKRFQIGLPRFRFNTHPEIAVITLRSKPID